MLKIFVDENIPLISVLELKGRGFEILDVRGTELEGISDEEVWNIAQQNQCLLITTDKGFSKKRFENHYGILIICLRQPNQMKIHDRIISAIQNTNKDEWIGKLIIMKDTTKNVWQYLVN